MKSYLVITLALIPVLTFSQNIDSLFTSYEKSKRLSTANEIMQELADLGHISGNQFTETQSPLFVDATINGAMALYHSDRGMYEEAIFHNLKSLAIHRSLNDSTYIVYKLQNLYVNYAAIGQYEKALDCLKESLDIATATDNRAMIANTLLCMGSLHAHNSNEKLAIESIEKGLEIKRRLNDTVKIIWALNSLCELFIVEDRIDDAQRCANEVYSLCNENTRASVKIGSMYSLSLIHKKKKEWDKAIIFIDSVLTEATKNDYTEYIYLSLLRLGEIYTESGRDPRKAEEYLLRSLEVSEKHNAPDGVMLASEKLYKLNKTKNAALALQYYEKSVDLYKEIQNEETKKHLENFHIQYKTSEKELEIEKQQRVIQQQSMQRLFLLTIVIVCLIILILLWQTLRLRNKRNCVLAEMNATKDRFFSIISHDLKNPAIAQRDALQLLMNSVGKWDVELLTQYYSELLKSADSQVELLYNLLNWAQVQTGRMPYAPRQFDLATALRSDITLIENMAKRKGIVTDMRIPQTAIVTGDSNMITTTIRNLLTNAVKFTPADNTVSLHIEPTEGATYSISIIDTGIGMNSEQLCNLFSIDHKRSRRGTNGESGSAMGLVVCKELIEKHGSTLNVESEEGKGSNFWFTLSNLSTELKKIP